MNTLKTIGFIVAVIGVCLVLSAFADWADPRYYHTIVPVRALIFAPFLLVAAIVKDLFR